MQSNTVNLTSDSVEVRMIYFTLVHMLILVQSGAEYHHDCEASLPLDQAQKMVGSKPAKTSKAEGAQEHCGYG